MDIDVMKSYLISLGFDLKQNEFDKAHKTLEVVDKQITGYATGWAKTFVAAGATIVGVYSAITAATIGLVDHVADADLNYQLFALRMYTSIEAARKMKIATDALGYSLEDIVWNKELHGRFDQLVADQARLQKHLGPDFEANMKRIRDIRFEFTRFKVEAQYLAMGFVSQLFKGFGTDAEHFVAKLRSFSDWVIRELPNIVSTLTGTLKPILDDIGISAHMIWEELKKATSWLIQFVGVLSGDTELQKGAVTFENIAAAIRHAVTDTSTFVEEIGMLIDSMLALSKLAGPGGPAIHAEAYEQWKKDMAGHRDSIQRLAANDPTSMRQILERPEAQGSAMLGPLAKFAPSLSQHAKAASSLADQARVLAMQVSKKTGIPANLIWEQWAHETGGFKNRGAQDLNNLAGIKDQGGMGYRSFGSLDDFANYYSSLLTSSRYTSKGVLQSMTAEDFAGALKGGGYYEDSYQNYVKGMKGFQSAYAKGGDVSIHVEVKVDKPHATEHDIANAVADKLDDKYGKNVQQNIMQLSPAY